MSATQPAIKQWLARIGRKGGKAKSAAKAKASAANGRKGGRPRKTKEDGK